MYSLKQKIPIKAEVSTYSLGNKSYGITCVRSTALGDEEIVVNQTNRSTETRPLAPMKLTVQCKSF